MDETNNDVKKEEETTPIMEGSEEVEGAEKKVPGEGEGEEGTPTE